MLATAPLKPIVTHSAAVFPYSEKLKEENFRYSRFGDPFVTYLERELNGHKVLWLPRGNYPLSDVDERELGEVCEFECHYVPHPKVPDQAKFVEKCVNLALAELSFVARARTGFGKTYCAMPVVAAVGRKTLVITTKEDIIEHWQKAAVDVLHLKPEEIGIWRGDTCQTKGRKLVIGLVQSIMKGPERYGPEAYHGFGLVLADEVHRLGADEFSQCMWWLPAKVRIGLSATPKRKDGKDVVFQGHIGPVMVTSNTEEMVPRVLMKQTNWKVPLVKKGAGYVKMPHQRGKTMHLIPYMTRHAGRNKDITDFVIAALGKDRHLIVFADTIDMLAHFEKMFVNAGIKQLDIGYYVGSSFYKGSPADKKKAREDSKHCRITLATYKMASEATDIPWKDTCVFGSPKSDVEQILGRIRRFWDDKKDPVAFDLVDDDSAVFAGYANARRKFYRKIGAEIVDIR